MTTHTCTNCNHVSSLPIDMEWEGFACVQCKHLFAKENNIIVDKGRVAYPKEDVSIEIGDSGMLEGELWTITGFSRQEVTQGEYLGNPEILNNHDGYDVPIEQLKEEWSEYYLINAQGEQIYLSNYHGVWTLAKVHNELKDSFANEKMVELADGIYSIYSKETFSTVCAIGFFKEAFPYGERISKDFICRPYAIFIEIDADGIHQYKARHITHREIRRGFPNALLLPAEASNILSPNFSNWHESSVIIGITTAFLILCFLFQSSKKTITSGQVTTVPSVAQVLTTNPFELTNLSQMVSIDINGDLSNNRAEVNAALLNVTTGVEYYSLEELTEYHGRDDEGNWSERCLNNTIRLCNIPPGQYVLELSNISPVQTTIYYNVTSGGRSNWTFLISLIILSFLTFIARGSAADLTIAHIKKDDFQLYTHDTKQ